MPNTSTMCYLLINYCDVIMVIVGFEFKICFSVIIMLHTYILHTPPTHYTPPSAPPLPILRAPKVSDINITTNLKPFQFHFERSSSKVVNRTLTHSKHFSLYMKCGMSRLLLVKATSFHLVSSDQLYTTRFIIELTRIIMVIVGFEFKICFS